MNEAGNKGMIILIAAVLGSIAALFIGFGLQPVVLWTDALIYLLLAVVSGFVFYARRRPHLSAPWRQVGRRRIGVITIIVLAVYVVTGLLDSIHFHPPLKDTGHQTQREYSPEVLSFLDVVLSHLREDVEKTYSAPFATHLFVKEAVRRPDGQVVREYPRLRYGGAQLADLSHKGRDIALTSLKAVVEAFAAFALVCLVTVGWLARRQRIEYRAMARRVARGETDVPWRAALLTVAAVTALISLGANLSMHYHVLGTDKVGQDVLYLAIKSIRTGLVIGTLTTLVMLPFAIALGVVAGYFGRWADDAIQYLYTTLSSIPGVLLIAAAILIMQAYIDGHPDQFNSISSRADARLLFLCIILGITSWTNLCRLLRGESLKLREMDYVQASSVLGANHLRIIARHIVPNVMHIVLIVVVIDFSGLVLAEAVLSYVGVGVDPSMISWGNMINSARLELARDPVVWWSLLAAFVFMFTLVLAANLFSDVVRDAFDPRVGGSS